MVRLDDPVIDTMCKYLKVRRPFESQIYDSTTVSLHETDSKMDRVCMPQLLASISGCRATDKHKFLHDVMKFADASLSLKQTLIASLITRTLQCPPK